jgi:hypothetical protein
MNSWNFFILLIPALCAVFGPRFLLQNSKDLTGDELRGVTPQFGWIGKWYPLLQILWCVVIGLIYGAFSLALNRGDLYRQPGLIIAWFSNIGILDGLIAMRMHIYPFPNRWGYHYIHEDSRRLKRTAILQLCLVAVATALAISWSIGIW